jgi:hypothetical protein
MFLAIYGSSNHENLACVTYTKGKKKLWTDLFVRPHILPPELLNRFNLNLVLESEHEIVGRT